MRTRRAPIDSLFLALLLSVAIASFARGQETSDPSPGDRQEPTDNLVRIRGQDYKPYSVERLRGYGYDIPDLPPDQNAATLHIEALNAAVDLPPDLNSAFQEAFGGTWPTGEDGDRLAAWLEQNKPSLDTIRQASVMEDYHMPLFQGDTDSLITALLPSLSPQRQLCKTLAVEATYLRSQGNADAAIESCMTAQRMAKQVAGGHTIIEGLVGYAISAVADKHLMLIADSGEANSEKLKAAAQEMESLAESFPTFEHMLMLESRFSATIIDDVINKPNLAQGMGVPLPLMAGPFTATQNSSPCWQRLAASLKRLYLPDRAMKRNLKRHYDTLLEATQRDDGGVGLTIDEVELFKQIPSWDVASRLVIPSLSRLYEVSLRHRSNHTRIRLALGTEAYRQDTGQRPESLSALVPEYVSTLPADPMTGYEFEYHPESTSGKGVPGGVKGLELITRDNEAELIKKRRAPAILTPRASKWRRFTADYCTQHQFTDAQRAAAEAILRDMESRAVRFEQVHGAKLQQLVEAAKQEDLGRATGPLVEMFAELRERLATLPTAEQKAEAEKNRLKKMGK